MNLKQKAYEYKDNTSKRLKLQESFVHMQKLTQIRNRKSLQIDNHTPFRQRMKHMPSVDKANNNSVILRKLVEIASKAPRPEINSEFSSMEKKRRLLNLNTLRIKRKVIDEENNHLFKRIVNSQSFISAKTLDKQYSNEHFRLLTKIKKVKEGDSLLPRIEKTPKELNNSTRTRSLQVCKCK